MPFTIDWIECCAGSDRLIKINTPVAKLVLSVRRDVIIDAEWETGPSILPSGENGDLQRLFNEYWLDAGKPITIKLLKQGSDYRNRVWTELCKIPYGATMTYSGLAQKIGSSARAVGNACRDNPYPLIIPCHRVIATGGIGGYCGQTEGGLTAVKKKLLQWEKLSGK
ncbi:MAG: methylated-DNA--[protein]-cysteine S-methyltransferase [Gammaproteobacteria bacterium]